MVDLTFDHYNGYDGMTEIIYTLAEEHPDLSELYSIVQSTDGRELWLIEITNKETVPVNRWKVI